MVENTKQTNLIQSSHIFSKSIQELIVDLPEYEERPDKGKPAVFYKIIVKLGNRQWQLWKRYSQFDQLDADLRAKYPQLPKLPGKTFFKIKANDDIKKRREELHLYLQDLVNRQDMRTNSHFREFLELDTQLPETVVNTPIKIAEYNELNLGGRDFIYLKEENLMFVAMSDMNITSRLDAYLTNISFPWESKTAKTDNIVGVGALQVFRVTQDEAGDQWTFERMWTKTFPSQTNILYWCQEMECLFVGLDSGRIHQFKVPKEYNYMRYQEVEPMKSHTKRVMGLAADKTFGYVYSVSEDGRFKVTEIHSRSVVQDMQPGKSALKQMMYIPSRAIFVIADSEGCIYIYNQNHNPPELLVRVQSQAQSCIRGLCLSTGGSYLVAGATDGSLSIFELNKPRSERFSKQLAHFQGRPGCRCIVWREKTREIITANQDGNITVWSAKDGTPIYVLQAHGAPITQLMWLEDKQQLISCSKDKTIKVWQLPQVWYDEERIKAKLKEEENKSKLEAEEATRKMASLTVVDKKQQSKPDSKQASAEKKPLQQVQQHRQPDDDQVHQLDGDQQYQDYQYDQGHNYDPNNPLQFDQQHEIQYDMNGLPIESPHYNNQNNFDPNNPLYYDHDIVNSDHQIQDLQHLYEQNNAQATTDVDLDKHIQETTVTHPIDEPIFKQNLNMNKESKQTAATAATYQDDEDDDDLSGWNK